MYDVDTCAVTFISGACDFFSVILFLILHNTHTHTQTHMYVMHKIINKNEFSIVEIKMMMIINIFEQILHYY
jgi:hypothetical protein